MIYRAVRNPTATKIPARSTSRAPGNVAFFVDNIWEWLRPAHMPCRRRSAFASSTPDLALAAVNDAKAKAYRVEGDEDARFCQITNGERPDDAKYHSDLSELKKLIIAPLGSNWFSAPIEDRLRLAPLFLPCASKDDVEELMAGDHPWDVTEIKGTCRFWHDVTLFNHQEVKSCPHLTGEIFFDGGYVLLPL